MSDYLQQIRQKVGHDLLLLPSAAVVLLDEQNRILFGRHADRNIWVLPGGLIEPAELPADAALRELWEETGLIAELTGILGVYGGPHLIVNYANGDQASYVGTIFRGRTTGGSLRPDGTEILELRYFSRGEFLTVPHAKWLDALINTLFNPIALAHFQQPTWRPGLE
jgi:8-oxo-dGTP pyrophosphatase MutT (NUDIX family)